MILLFGGTTEAKAVAGWLAEAGKEFVYSTKTPVTFEGKGRYRFGPLDREGLASFCQENKISCIINASHPFATELHQTVASLAGQLPLIRVERKFPERFQHPLLNYVKGYEPLLHCLEEQQVSSLLALSGVQSIAKLKPFWQCKKAWFRILDRPESRAFAAAHAFPEENLLFGSPQQKEEEEKLFRTLNPAVILTKESGENGKLQDKIEAAIACQIPICIIEKPALPAAYQLVQKREELLRLLP